MKKRNAIIRTVGIGLALIALGTAQAGPKQLIELRTYKFASAEKQAAYAKFLGEVAVPALNRAGVKPVGIFKMDLADNPKVKQVSLEETDLVVVLPFNDAATMLNLEAALDADKAYQKAGKAILNPPKKDPAFLRVTSSLMLSFDECPKLEIPAKGKDRVFQLRVYESHSADRALRKVEMFNEGGELALFRKVGMAPVFFGQTLAGERIPNLTYLLGFDNAEKQAAGWDAFLKHPEWDAMKKDPTYKDTVSRITNDNLRPVKGSQI